MLMKITLTCFLFFVFAAIASLPYKEKSIEDTPDVIVYSVYITMVATLISVLVLALDAIWGFTQ